MRTITAVALAFAAGTALCAQDTAGVRTEIRTTAGPAAGFIDGPGFGFISGEMVGGKPLTGVPYSAQAVSETTQTLADGNRIVQRSTSTIYRDSLGRERREQSLSMPGLLSATGASVQTIFISDPVAGVNYSLNPAEHVAIKLPAPTAPPMMVANPTGGDVTFAVSTGTFTGAVPAGGPQMMVYQNISPGDNAPPPPKSEQLGNRVIEGVSADGTRMTLTIPAGQIGNDQPIQVVSETWYSPELQVTVLSTHSDPRIGQTVYSLTGISRAEPLSTLFQVPPDYTVKDAPAMNIQRMEKIQKP